MVSSGILGADMNLMFFFRFFVNQIMGGEAVIYFYKFLINNCVFSVFWGQVIPALRSVGVCRYLYHSCSLLRFSTLAYCSVRMNGLGGEFNDFNK